MQKNKNAGFTLIELLIVVAIIAILAMIVMPIYQNHIIETQQTTALSTIKNIVTPFTVASIRGQTPTLNQIYVANSSASGNNHTLGNIVLDTSTTGQATITITFGNSAASKIQGGKMRISEKDNWACTVSNNKFDAAGASNKEKPITGCDVATF